MIAPFATLALSAAPVAGAVGGALGPGLAALGPGAMSWLSSGIGVGGGGGVLGGMGGMGGAAGGGLFGGLGSLFGKNAFPAMMGAGMGMGLANAYSQGSAPQIAMGLSETGKKVKEELWDTAEKQYESEYGLLPKNLASIYIGKIKKASGAATRQSRKIMTQMTAKGSTGAGLKSAVRAAGMDVEAGAAPAKWKAETREGAFRRGRASMQNLMNLETQTALFNYGSSLNRRLQQQMARAGQGQALGDMARYMAMMRYPING